MTDKGMVSNLLAQCMYGYLVVESVAIYCVVVPPALQQDSHAHSSTALIVLAAQ